MKQVEHAEGDGNMGERTPSRYTSEYNEDIRREVEAIYNEQCQTSAEDITDEQK